jgi:hypothetical protein
MDENGNVTINQREFRIWKLEKWWVAFNSPQFEPEGRIKIGGSWYWRKVK